MSEARIPHGRRSSSEPIPRRQAIQGIAALAMAPAGLAVACSGTDETGNGPAVPAGGAPGGGGPGSGGVGVPSPPGSGGVTQPSSGGALGSTSGGAQPVVQGAGGQSPGGLSGAGGAETAAGGAGVPGTGGNAAGGAPGITFDDVASCTLTPTDRAGEGPFFIHEDEVMTDPSIVRSDMRDGHAGVEFQLHIRVLDSDGGCNTPIAGVEVYVWHTDALGWYSGFANQDPDKPYSGGFERTVENDERFCRGVQVTDADGVVSFRTIYPGWYDGRAIHVHFVALRKGSGAVTTSYRSPQYMVFTTQMYFDEQFSRNVHENNTPYDTRASGPNYDRYVVPESPVRPTLTMDGNVVVGKLNVVTSSAGSRR